MAAVVGDNPGGQDLEIFDKDQTGPVNKQANSVIDDGSQAPVIVARPGLVLASLPLFRGPPLIRASVEVAAPAPLRLVPAPAPVAVVRE